MQGQPQVYGIGQNNLSHELTTTDRRRLGDESLPWRQIRSRSLQPPMRGRNRPSERGRGRSLSIHRLIQSRGREPVRPWIEETIKLKPAIIKQKVIEREQLETVLKAVKLKPSQIERRQLIREELEKVELKSVQREYLNAVLSQIADTEEIPKDDFRAYIYEELQKVKKFEENIQHMESIKSTEDASILQLTKQVDELVMRDALRHVPRKQLYMQEKPNQLQSLNYTEDSNILRVDNQIETAQQHVQLQSRAEVQDINKENATLEKGVFWRKSPKDIKHQTYSYLEDSELLHRQEELTQHDQQISHQLPVHPRTKVEAKTLRHLEDLSLLNMSQTEEESVKVVGLEQPVNWRKPRQMQHKQETQHVEDISTLNVSENMQILQAGTTETPVNWRKVRHPKQELTHTEDVSLLNVSEDTEIHQASVETPETPAHWRKPRQPKQEVTHMEDMSLLNVSDDTEIHQATVEKHEKPVNWRKPKKPQQELTHTENMSLLNVSDDTEMHQATVQTPETPAHWRKPRQPKQELAHSKDVSTLSITEATEATQQSIATKEEPVNWRKAKKPTQLENVEDTAPVQTLESVDLEQFVPETSTPEKPVHWRRPQVTDSKNAQHIQDTQNETQVSNTSIIMKQQKVSTKVQPAVEMEPTPEFIKTVDMKVASQITKTEKRTMVYDNSQPLPELELITQRRVMVSTDDIEENAVVQETGPVEDGRPRFIKDLSPQKCKPGEPMKLTCSFVGEPRPSISWFFNNTELFASEKIIIQSFEDCAELQILNVQPSICGVYTCVASNLKGRAVSRSIIGLGKRCNSRFLIFKIALQPDLLQFLTICVLMRFRFVCINYL